MDMSVAMQMRLAGFAAGVIVSAVVLAVRVALDPDARRGLMSLFKRDL